MEDLAVRGLFYGIGHQPNSSLVEGQLELDDKGYVKVPCMIYLHHCRTSTAIFCILSVKLFVTLAGIFLDKHLLLSDAA